MASLTTPPTPTFPTESAYITTDAKGSTTIITMTTVYTVSTGDYGLPPTTLEIPMPITTDAGTHTVGPNPAVTIGVSTGVSLIGILIIYGIIAYLWRLPWGRNFRAQRGWGGTKLQDTEPTPLTSTSPTNVEAGKAGFAFSPGLSPQDSRIPSSVQALSYSEGPSAASSVKGAGIEKGWRSLE